MALAKQGSDEGPRRPNDLARNALASRHEECPRASASNKRLSPVVSAETERAAVVILRCDLAGGGPDSVSWGAVGADGRQEMHVLAGIQRRGRGGPRLRGGAGRSGGGEGGGVLENFAAGRHDIPVKRAFRALL